MWKTELKVHYSKLSKGQKQVADYLLQQDESIGNMTIRDCARGGGVGQPTIIRMLRKCGYESWSSFQHEVWKDLGKQGKTESEGFMDSTKKVKEFTVWRIYYVFDDRKIGEGSLGSSMEEVLQHWISDNGTDTVRARNLASTSSFALSSSS